MPACNLVQVKWRRNGRARRMLYMVASADFGALLIALSPLSTWQPSFRFTHLFARLFTNVGAATYTVPTECCSQYSSALLMILPHTGVNRSLAVPTSSLPAAPPPLAWTALLLRADLRHTAAQLPPPRPSSQPAGPRLLLPPHTWREAAGEGCRCRPHAAPTCSRQTYEDT